MFIRIDDRLIHGQVVTAWLRHLKAKTILVADDAAAGNAMVQRALKIATPAGIELFVQSVLEAGQSPARSGDDVMIIVRNPLAAQKLIDAASEDRTWEVNIGNVGQAAGRKKITTTVYLDAENEAALSELAAKGVRLYYQTVPSGPRQEYREQQ